MIIIANKSKKNNKFFPMINIVNKDIKKLKNETKKQLINEIINNPTSLKAYKDIEVYKLAEVNEGLEFKNYKKELLFSYEEILNEIIENLTKEQKDEQIK